MTSETTPVSTTARQTTVESVHSSTKPLISKLLWTSKAFVASPLPLVMRINKIQTTFSFKAGTTSKKRRLVLLFLPEFFSKRPK